MKILFLMLLVSVCVYVIFRFVSSLRSEKLIEGGGKQSLASKGGSMAKWFVLFLAIVLMLAGVWLFGSILGFFLVYPQLSAQLTSAGFNVHLAKLIALPFAASMAIGLTWVFSFSQAKRIRGAILAGAATIIWCLVMYFSTASQNFNPITGEAVRTVFSTPEGSQYGQVGWKVDPTYGQPVRPVNAQSAVSDYIQKNGLPDVNRVSAECDSAFFADDGSPLVWYYQSVSGKVELFAQPGRHPQYGSVVLQPINSAIVELILAECNYSGSKLTVNNNSVKNSLNYLRKKQQQYDK